MEQPSAFGPAMQWKTNKRRMIAGMVPFPGPRPRPEDLKRRIKIRRKKRG